MFKTQKKLISLALLLGFMMLAGLPIRAQREDYPKGEIFGGYTYASIDTTARNLDRQHAHGWALSANGNVNRFFGLTVDLAGHYGNFRDRGFPGKVDFRVYEYLFGPTFSARTDKVTGFAHILAGPSRLTADLGRTSVSQTKFSMGIGGGVDFNVNRNVAIRGIQVDYLPIRLGRINELGFPANAAWSQNVRLKTGIVFKF